MGNYVDYLNWRGDLSFEQAPFNEIDSAVLAEVSYFPFEHVSIQAHDTSTISRSITALLQHPDLEEMGVSKRRIPVLEALYKSERFLEMPILEYRDIFDESHQVQFAVITIQLEPNLYYVSYRGTDHTLVGWREDFNMVIEFPVLSQKLAAIYLNGLAGNLPGEFILGGHSKGGNLAVYAGAFCEASVQERIREIYNFDGPGFESWIMSQPAYRKIADRINTFVPQSSVIGMLLEQAEGYQVVHSTGNGTMGQHRMNSWQVDRDHFVKLESVTDKSLFLDSAITEWIHSMDYEQRKTFIDALFNILEDAEVKSPTEISPKKIGQMLGMVKSYMGLEPEVRSHMNSAIAALIRCAREEAPAFGMEGFRLFRKTKQTITE